LRSATLTVQTAELLRLKVLQFEVCKADSADSRTIEAQRAAV